MKINEVKKVRCIKSHSEGLTYGKFYQIKDAGEWYRVQSDDYGHLSDFPKYFFVEEGEEKKNSVRLEDLPSGSLFTFNGTTCLKSEYMTKKGAVQAYIVGSGEMFWGGTNNAEDLNNLPVTEIKWTL